MEWNTNTKGLGVGQWEIYFRLKGDDSHKSTREILDIEQT